MKERVVRWTRSVGFVAVAVLLVGAGAWAERSEAPSQAQLAFLAVGQGDCTVLISDGRTILIDAGPANERLNGAAKFVVPALYDMRVKTIDLILITHPDADHMGGLAAISRRFKIGKVGLGARFADHPVAQQFLREAGIKREQMWWITGEHAGYSEPFVIRVRDAAPAGVADNDGSLLVHVQAGKATALLTGDASVSMESLVPDSWRSQILHAGHHGSRTSTGDELLARTQPEIAIVSCGRDNAYGHPHGEVLRRLERNGVKVYRTDKDGHLKFVPSPEGFQRVPSPVLWRNR